MFKAATAVALCALALTGCSSGATPEPAPTPSRESVPWQDYSPEVKTRIDDMTNAKDCTGLQSEFDLADQNDAATRSRTGTHGNAELMGYIDEALSMAGCY